MESIKLNLVPFGSMPVCHVSEKDEGRQIRIDLYDGPIVYEIQSGDEIKVDILKPNGDKVSCILECEDGDSFVILNTLEEMCDVVGRNLCELKITNGHKKIGTLNFYMDVEETLGDVEPLPSREGFVLFSNGKWRDHPDYDITFSETGKDDMQIIDNKLYFVNTTGFSIYSKINHGFLLVASCINLSGEHQHEDFFVQTGRCIKNADVKIVVNTGANRISYHDFNGQYQFDGAVVTQGIDENYASNQAIFLGGSDICFSEICVFPIINDYTLHNWLN